MSTVQTNMVHFYLDERVSEGSDKRKGIDPATLCQLLREKHNILTIPSFANDCIRLVTHRDVDQADLEHTHACIKTELAPFL